MNSESTLLGQIILDNDILFKKKIKTDYFLSPQNRQIIRTVKKIVNMGEVADIAIIYKENESISPSYLSSLPSHSSANWEYYYKNVLEKYRMNKLNNLQLMIQDSITKNDSKAIMSLIEDELIDICSDEGHEIKHISEEVTRIVNKIEERYNRKGQLPGIETGLGNLDDYLLGLQEKLLYCIGARPSEGKSALMANIALHIGLKQNVGVINLESAIDETVERMFSIDGRIQADRIKTGLLKPVDFHGITETAGRLYESKIYFYDKPNADLDDVCMSMRKMKNIHDVKVIFIDYLQLIECGSHKQPMRDRVGKVSRTLKDMARKLNLPIVCLAQLRRDADNRKPRLSDFSESSQIEKDADAAILIYHNDEGSYLLVEKNRDGKTGSIPITFEKEYITMKEVVK